MPTQPEPTPARAVRGGLMVCERCGLRPRHTRTLCKPCRQRERYHDDPVFRARRVESSRTHYRKERPRVVDRITDYNRAHPAERHQWVTTWRLRHGRALPPDLVEFRRAINVLDAAVERAKRLEGVRESGQIGGDDAAQR